MPVLSAWKCWRDIRQMAVQYMERQSSALSNPHSLGNLKLLYELLQPVNEFSFIATGGVGLLAVFAPILKLIWTKLVG